MAATGAKPPEMLSFEYFEAYTKTCHARKIQEQADEIRKQAIENKTDFMEELKKRGHADFKSFARQCRKFNVMSWPIELGELGSGVVLYFHFLALAASIFLVTSLLQIGPVSDYVGINDAVSNQCGWSLVDDWTKAYDNDESFSKDDFPLCSNAIGSGWWTPGSYGPSQADGSWIPMNYLACVVVVILLSFLAHIHQSVTDERVDSDVLSPNDFAALVSGLPTTATDEKEILDFFKANAIKGRQTEIVKVVIGWDASEWRGKMQELRALSAELRDLEGDPSNPRIAKINERKKAITEALSSVAEKGATKLRSSGTVVVLFRHQRDLRKFLNRFSGFWASAFYCDGVDVPCLPTDNGLLCGSELPKFPLGDRPVYKMSVQRAPNPGDINWEELGISKLVRWKRMAETNGLMFLIIACCFGIVYAINKAQDTLDANEGTSYRFLSVLPAIVTAFANVCISIYAKKLGAREHHGTHTEEQFSQALKMTIGMIITTAAVPLFINAQPREWYKAGGLVDDIYIQLIVNSLFPPLIVYLDPAFCIKSLKRRNLTQGKIDRMNEGLTPKPKPPTEAEQQTMIKEMATCRAMKESFEKAYRPSEMNNPRRYANALKTFFCNLFYMPVLPMCSLIGLCGLVLMYAVDKYLVTRWYSRAEKPSNAAMAKFSLRFIKLVAPLLLTFSLYGFLAPSWEDKNEVMACFWLALFFSILFSFMFPIELFALVVRRCLAMTRSANGLDNVDYYAAQYSWSTEMKYHKDQFIYKKIPESKNPEYLKEGADSTTSVSDAKSAYGFAARDAAARAAGGGGKKMRLRGGKVIAEAKEGGGDEEAPAGASYSAPSHGVPAKATTYGVPAKDPAPDEGGHVAGVAAPAGACYLPGYIPGASAAAATSSPGRAGASRWEFEVHSSRTGWEPFNNDCQAYIEKQYQLYKNGAGQEEITVRTKASGKELRLTVNFREEKQWQQGADRSRGRRIRRVPQ